MTGLAMHSSNPTLPPRGSHSRCKPALGTFVKVHLRGHRPSDELMVIGQQVFAEIKRIEALMSYYRPTSELALINRTAHCRPLRLSPEMRQVLTFALELSEASSGYFDPTVAGRMIQAGLLPKFHSHAITGNWRDIRIDGDSLYFETPLILELGGIAKGFAMDCAFAKVPKDVEVVVNAGGDLRMRPWRLASVFVPTPGKESLLETPMHRQALATSATYYQKGRLCAPSHAAQTLPNISTSVFAPSCMAADALTKIAWQGAQAEPVLKAHRAIALLIEEDGSTSWFGGA